MSNLENYMKQQAIFCEQNDSISKNLYSEYGVKRGLRDEKGQGDMLPSYRTMKYKSPIWGYFHV